MMTMKMTRKNMTNFMQLFCHLSELRFVHNAEPSVRIRQQTALCITEICLFTAGLKGGVELSLLLILSAFGFEGTCGAQ